MKIALSLAFVLVAACGGKSKPATTETAKMAGMDHHEAMMPEIGKFHDVIAPRWHAEKGAKRMTDTCAAVGEMQTAGATLAKATPPAPTDATVWAAKNKELTDALVALDGTCKANDAAAFEPAFALVHTSFHAVMEASGAHHEEHHDEGHEGHDVEHMGHEGGEHKM